MEYQLLNIFNKIVAPLLAPLQFLRPSEWQVLRGSLEVFVRRGLSQSRTAVESQHRRRIVRSHWS